MKVAKSASRGDQTREALILAALEVFGRNGYDAASTRAIAEAAGVNQALIGYHFGGKHGLYLGVFEHIVARMRRHLAPAAAAVQRALADVPGEEAGRRAFALQMILRVFDSFIDMIGEGEAAGWVRLIIREQQEPTEAFQLLWDGMLARMMELLNRLVAMASGLDESSDACRIRSLMLLGQVLMVHIARASTTRHLGRAFSGPDDLATFKEQCYLVLHAQFPEAVPQS